MCLSSVKFNFSDNGIVIKIIKSIVLFENFDNFSF